jgi:putative membrane protein
MSEQDSSRTRQIAGWAIVGLAAVIGVAVAISLFFSPRPLGGFFPFGWFGGIFLIFIIFGIARWFFWPWRGYGYRHRNAESILRERYAKGEITREQFQQMKDDLKHDPQA